MTDLYIWPEMPFISIATLVTASMIFLYLARTPLHLALQSLDEGIAGGLTKISIWINNLVEKMREKSKKVLLESSIADCEQKLLTNLNEWMLATRSISPITPSYT